MPQVFISYSRKDIEFVERLVSDLKSAGLTVWYDLSGLDGGSQWGTEIQKAIQQSQYFIIVLSPNSLESKWVQREFLFAESIKLKVIPLLYRPCELPMWLLDLHLIDLQGNNYDLNFDRIIKALGVKSQAERMQAQVAADTKARLEAQEKDRIAREEKQKQHDHDEHWRKQVEQDDLKAKLEMEEKERRVREEQLRQQKAEEKVRRQSENQQLRIKNRTLLLKAWKKMKPKVLRLGVVGILAILAVLIGAQLISGGFGTSPLSTATNTPSVTSEPSNTPSVTPEPSITPLPVSTLESSFIVSINDHISQATPSFEDDFSTPNQKWGYTRNGQFIPDLIQNGQLSFARSAEGGNISFPSNGLFMAEDFVLQYDYFYTGWNTFGVEFHASPAAEGSRSYFEFSITYYDYSKTWNLNYRDNLLKPGEQLLENGNVKSQIGFNNIKIFCRQNHLVVFINDIKIIDKNDLKSLTGSDNLIFTTGIYSSSTFDNVKFWNLDGVDLNP